MKWFDYLKISLVLLGFFVGPVVVNGQIVLNQGKPNGKLPGGVLKLKGS